MSNKAAVLRHRFQTKPILRVMGAHHALGAKLIEKNGFDAVWASGLEISASFAVPDANILTMTENLHVAASINEATELPLICDCDTGYGNASNVSHLVKKYELAGVAAVVIEDKLFPKVNSFIPGRQELATVEEFMGKIEAAKNAQRNQDFMVFARIEALIAGWGMDEALRRAYAYAEAGADGLVIHSKATTPDEVYDFSKKWKGALPLVVIPTTFYNVTADDLANHGIRMVIYANQGLRASIRAMDQTFKRIYEAGSTAPVENEIASVKEVFELQGMSRFKEEERRYSRKDSVQALIPAAGDPGLRTDLGQALKEGPVCMLPIGGKTLLDRQMDTFRSCGVSDIFVVGGYAGSSIRAEGATLIQNEDYAATGVVRTMLAAHAKLKGHFIMTYSDIIFDRQIVERLLESPYDITLVMDRAYQTLPAREKKLDLVIAERPSDQAVRRLGNSLFKPVQKVGRSVSKAGANYEFIGMVLFREDGWDAFLEAWNRAQKKYSQGPFYEAASIQQADVTDMIQYLIDEGVDVHGLEIEHGWSELHSLEDFERVNSFYREQSPKLASA